MKIGFLNAIFLFICVQVLAQFNVSRATVQQALGFEDQTNTTLRGPGLDASTSVFSAISPPSRDNGSSFVGRESMPRIIPSSALPMCIVTVLPGELRCGLRLDLKHAGGTQYTICA